MLRFSSPANTTPAGAARPDCRPGVGILVSLLVALLTVGCGGAGTGPADTLLAGGTVYDGEGGEPFSADLAVTADEITFLGDAGAQGVEAADTLDVSGLMVVPGFIDMHSHAEVDEAWGHDVLPFLYQGITTLVMGVDGGGTPDVADRLANWREQGIGANALTYVGHGAVRRRVFGEEDRPPTPDEMEEMKALVRKGIEEGAFGFSTGLFYVPGTYATTEEVIELATAAVDAAGPEGSIYDSHDRDLGAVYQGVGYLSSIREGIEITGASGSRGIFSHFNAQGARNYGRAPEGAALIDSARAAGVQVAGAQHVYTATQSNLESYTIPDWASNGGDTAMIRRFDDPDTVAVIDEQSREMLAIRGGADQILFADPRPELNGKTLRVVADEWGMEPTAAARRILRDGNAAVMNLELYDPENTRFLARQEWMMTCTDGRTPRSRDNVVHPRVYGAFTKKLRDFVLDEGVISMSFAIRSMTGLAADFLGLPDRGYLDEGMKADIAVLDRDRIRDNATYENPHRYSDGTVHVLVNGAFALRDGEHTGALAGEPLIAGGEVFEGR